MLYNLLMPLIGEKGIKVDIGGSNVTLDADVIDVDMNALLAATNPVVASSGTKEVGDTSAGNAVQLSAGSVPCKYVILAAPSVKEASGLNTNPVYAHYAADAPTHANALLNGRYIGTANFEGIRIYTDNVNKVYLAGFTAGDSVRWQAVN